MKKAFIAFDFHVPFHNVDFVADFLLSIKKKKPDLIILGGDFLDCYGISKFDSSPNRADNFEYERDCAVDLLRQIRMYAGESAEIVFIKGNHEERIPKSLMRGKVRALYSLPELQIPTLLKLNLHQIKYCEHIYRLNSNTIIIHGSRCNAKAEAMSWLKSGFSGHIHKDLKFQENYLDTNIIWHSVGAMCDLNQIDYAENFKHKWNNSYAEIEFDNLKVKTTIII